MALGIVGIEYVYLALELFPHGTGGVVADIPVLFCSL